MRPSLSDLPEEILLNILSSVSFSPIDLHALALVNKRFSALVPSFLYTDIVFPFRHEDTQTHFWEKDVEGTDIASVLGLSNLSRTMSNPSFASLVQSFVVLDMHLHLDTNSLVEHITFISARARGLQSLKINVGLNGFLHEAPWEKDFLDGIPFQSLRSLYIGFHLPFAQFCKFLFLPALEQISIRGFRDSDTVEIAHLPLPTDRKPHTSRVTDIDLQAGCDFGKDIGWKTVFSWPQKLEKLTATIIIVGGYNPGLVARQLEPAMKSLVDINISADTDEYSTNPDNSIMSFDKYVHLQRLKISSCLLFQDWRIRTGLFSRLPPSLKELEIGFQEYESITITARENGDPNPQKFEPPPANASLVAEDHLWIYELAVYKDTHLPNLTTVHMRENLSAGDAPNYSSHRWIPPKTIADLMLSSGIELDIRIRSYRRRPTRRRVADIAGPVIIDDDL